MKKLLALLLALAMVLSLAACGSSGSSDTAAADTSADTAADTAADSDAAPADDSSAAPAADAAEGLTLNVGHSSKSVDGFDPPSTGNEIGLYLVYQTLFVRNPDNNNEIENYLATDYNYVDDCTVEITIADEATFSNGEPVTASDVLFSLKRIVDSNSQYMDYYTCIDYDASYAKDDKTVVIVTTDPTPMLFAYLAMPYASVLCQSYVEASSEEDFWDKPVGSGPYTCVENISGSHTTYAVRDDYWGEAPDYATIVVNNYSDATSMFVDFETGILDIAFDISASDTARLQNGEVSGATAVIAPTYNALAIALPEYTEVFSDVRVREAICEAIDIDAVTTVAFGILATPSTSVVADGMDYHVDVSGNRYDPDHAKELLAEAGYADGLDLRMVICAVDFQEKISETVQSMLAAVGINLTIESYDIPTAVGMFMSGDTDLVINAQSSMALDPAQQFVTTESTSTNLTTALTDAEINGYLTTGRTSLDTDVRAEAYANAQQWMADNYRQIPLCDRAVAYAVASTVASCNVVTPQEPNLMFAHAAK